MARMQSLEPMLRGWECTMLQPVPKTVLERLEKIKRKIPRDPAIPLLGVCRKEAEVGSRREIRSQQHRSRQWNRGSNPRLLTDERMSKIRCVRAGQRDGSAGIKFCHTPQRIRVTFGATRQIPLPGGAGSRQHHTADIATLSHVSSFRLTWVLGDGWW